ncbi:hypothetical protein [Thermobacillus composti]|nr:hypothetical protein [Thermobacillus composti]
MNRVILWPPAVRSKLSQFRSERFSPEETFDFISQLILETEAVLTNPIIGKAYTEENGTYVGLSRVVQIVQLGGEQLTMPVPNKPDRHLSEDDCGIDDILESAGVLTPEQAAHLIDEIKRMREEEWE